MISKLRLVGLLVAPALLLVGMPSVAQADTPGCVTRTEYRAVSRGMTMAKVHGIFDTTGTRDAYSTSGGYAIQIRSYKACRAYSYISIAFDRDGYGKPFRLSNKTAVWSY
jgi:hypothetical protein